MFPCLSHIRMMRSVCSIGRNASHNISLSLSNFSSSFSGSNYFRPSVSIRASEYNNIPTSVRSLSSSTSTNKKEARPLSPLRHFRILRRENPQLRVHAVSLWDSDYTDTTSSMDDVNQRNKGLNNDMYSSNNHYHRQDKDDDAEIARRVKEEDKKEQERLAKARAPPIDYPTVIDSLGRSFGRGGRKTSTAQVWIEPGEGHVTINRKPFIEYFTRESHREQILLPLMATQTCGKFDIIASVRGGGNTGQAGAVRHGLSRALHAWNPNDYRPILKSLGMLTRDPRMVERKKPGLKKARKASQWRRR